MKTINRLKNLKKEGNTLSFNKLLDILIHPVEGYVKHRIKFYEIKGRLPVNFYQPAEILADIYLKVYDQINKVKTEKELKTVMFKLADEIIESYVRKENQIKEEIPVDKIIADELSVLQEKLTANAEGEPVLVQDLTYEDISYMQKEFKPHIYLFDLDTQKEIVRALGLEQKDFEDERVQNLFGSMYAQLPDMLRKILDLSIFGKLTPEEIASVINVQEAKVQEILIQIKAKIQ